MDNNDIDLNKQFIWSGPFKIALLVALVIFLVDLLVPLGVAIGIAYVLCILLVSGESQKSILAIAAITSFLTLFSILFLYNTEVSWMAFVNRVITLCVISLSAIVAIRYSFLDRQKVLHEKIAAKSRDIEQFTFATSHDLQGPLRTITEFAKILKAEKADKLDDEGKQMLDFILGASLRMTKMIQDLLDYSRIGKNKEMEIIDSNELIQELVIDLASNIKSKNAKIECGLLPQVKANRGYFKQLLQNLIANAIKFNKPELAPEVKIEATTHNGSWLFSVQDNGIGIDPKQHDKIFDVFHRLHDEAHYPGSGIGLAHCKKIVEIHNGKIWLESAEGQGSTFYFTLPDHAA